MWQLGGPADYRYLKNTVGVEISGEDAAVELAKLKVVFSAYRNGLMCL